MLDQDNVTNSAPRPEGYAEDYETAWGDTIGQNTTGFDLSKRSLIYKNVRRFKSHHEGVWCSDVRIAQLATGAESGQDYSAARCVHLRFELGALISCRKQMGARTAIEHFEQPAFASDAQQCPAGSRAWTLRSLAQYSCTDTFRGQVDLNSILYSNMEILSKLYLVKGSTYNAQKSQAWAAKAQARRAAVLDLNWDKSRLGAPFLPSPTFLRLMSAPSKAFMTTM